MRDLLIVLLAAVVAVGCGGQDVQARFDRALENGASCAELFEIRNEAEPGSGDVEEMNVKLRQVGCFSSTSTRTDQ